MDARCARAQLDAPLIHPNWNWFRAQATLAIEQDRSLGPMSVLEPFGTGLSVAVFGASGGIGRALTDILQSDISVERVYALSRTEPEALGEKSTGIAFDMLDDAGFGHRGGGIDHAAEHTIRAEPIPLGIAWINRL